MADGEAKTSNWLWIGGAAIATFLIASVLPTAILRNSALLCLQVGLPADACMAPFQGSAEISGSYVTGLTMSVTTTAKIVLALIAAGITALMMRRRSEG